jgi:multidrug efflux pump subunit AcrA (membrane-fusion protein)
MLKGFDEDIAGLDLPDEVKKQLMEAANKRASGLLSKNEELLGKLNETKSIAKEGQSAAEKLAAMEALQEQQALEAKQNYEEALALTKQKSQKEIEELRQRVELFENEKRDTLIGGGISDALTEARVNPLHMEYVTTYFKQKAQLVDGKVVIGDQSLSDVIAEWAETDSGKAVRLAPDNSGGGANGGGIKGPGSGKELTDSQKRASDINKRLGVA